MSRTSKKIEHLHSIAISTHGILFFGTPHGGSDKENMAAFAQRLVGMLPSKVVDIDSQLLDALKKGSEVLQNITDNFAPLINRYHIFFFWEQRKTDLGVRWDYVSEPVSLERMRPAKTDAPPTDRS